MNTRKRRIINYTIFITCVLLLVCIVFLCFFRIVKLTEMGAGIVTLSLIAIILIMGLALLSLVNIAKLTKNIDPMTQIGNNVWIMNKGGYLHHTRKLQENYKILFLNIKDCNYINRKLGGRQADLLLRQYALILEAWLQKDRRGYVGRMDGDNFVAFCKNGQFNAFLAFLRAIYIEIPDEDGDMQRMHVKVRAGISDPNASSNFRDLITFAHRALYASKKGTEDFVFFERSMQEQANQESEVMALFRRAVKYGEFTPFFQPKVDVETGRLYGAEALARWIKDDKTIMPAEFIPALEKNGKIVELDYYIFERTCAHLRSWIDAGLQVVPVSCNFSKLHLKDTEFVPRLVSIKEQYNLPGGLLDIELTESLENDDYDVLHNITRELKKEDFKVSIDDFGKGYSSLAMLRHFDADMVKLDRSFIYSSLEVTGDGKEFFKDIIRMIDRQKKLVLCEGVETKEQLQFLRESNCKLAQGFFFDKPLPAITFEKRLRDPQYNVD